MEAVVQWAAADDDGWRCRKHPSAQRPTDGVCPVCLRARLLRLCPDCAGERPCGCSCASTSSAPSSSSSLSSSSSSLDLPRSGARGGYVGAVGRVSQLIESEPAFRRSRSTAFRLLRPRPHESAGRPVDAPPSLETGKGQSWLWPFAKTKKPDEDCTTDAPPAATRLSRSRSVEFVPGSRSFPDPGGSGDGGGCVGVSDGDVKWKRWNRYFASPMKAFRQRKSSNVVEARSPLCRGREKPAGTPWEKTFGSVLLSGDNKSDIPSKIRLDPNRMDGNTRYYGDATRVRRFAPSLVGNQTKTEAPKPTMRKKRTEEEAPADILSDAFKSLFASDNPFRRKPEPTTLAPPPPQQQGLVSPSVGTDDGATAGTPIDGRNRRSEGRAGEVDRKKRKEPISPVDSAEIVLDARKKKRKSDEGEEAAGAPSKRRKKRKRDDLEVEYEMKKLGYVEDQKDASDKGVEDGKCGLPVAVGQKRKEMDEGKEMVGEEESFDDESKLVRTVFVGNLPLKTKRKVLLKEFRRFGEVESIRIRSVPILDSKIPRKGAIIKGKLNDAVDSVHAYIVFKDEQSAHAALKLNMEKIGGNHIRVDMACPPRKKLKGETPLYNTKRTIFVGNLPFDVKDEELYQLLCQDNQFESTVEAIRVVRDPNTSLGKGIAYVLFRTREAANSVVRRKDLNLRGRDLRLSHARSESAPSKATPSKRASPSTKIADFPNKRLEFASEKSSGKANNKPGKAGSLAYQGLRASKSGVQKKAKRSGANLNYGGRAKLEARSPGSTEEPVRKQKRPAVAARKAKALRQSGIKRKQESRTPENFQRSKKARHLK